jgi:endonuclease/exonuclease/phosphatase family metal-dependent hydrolase
MPYPLVPCFLLCGVLLASTACTAPTTLRIATWNAEDIRSTDLTGPDQPRLVAAGATIRALRPDILLLNEIAFDPEGQNAGRFVDQYLTPETGGEWPMSAWMPQVNTGKPSGHDLDRSGTAMTTPPPEEAAGPDGSPPRQTPEQRAYGNDAWGFGTFPGQYGMALLVRPDLEILEDEIRTFRLFPWSALPEAEAPSLPDGTPWYTPEAWASFRLPSKTLASVPVRLPSGEVLYCVISHPTPPAFDGPEGRNKLRNRDEIRLLRAYLDNEPWLVDDAGDAGGLPPGAHVVVLGDLNADPLDGNSVGDPIGHLFGSEALGSDPRPISETAIEGLDPTDTARFRLRVDYVLPGRSLTVTGSGIDRSATASDHFPVWVDLVVPDRNPGQPGD